MGVSNDTVYKETHLCQVVSKILHSMLKKKQAISEDL